MISEIRTGLCTLRLVSELGAGMWTLRMVSEITFQIDWELDGEPVFTTMASDIVALLFCILARLRI